MHAYCILHMPHGTIRMLGRNSHSCNVVTIWVLTDVLQFCTTPSRGLLELSSSHFYLFLEDLSQQIIVKYLWVFIDHRWQRELELNDIQKQNGRIKRREERVKKCLQIVGLWKNSWKCDSRPIRPTGKTNLETIFNSTREINRFNM